jgi:glycerol kinase
MQHDSGVALRALKVDGGATGNNLLMQLQADVLGVPVRRPAVQETTALGAAYLAGLAVGFWSDRQEVVRNWVLAREFQPQADRAVIERAYRQWNRAVERSRGWAVD